MAKVTENAEVVVTLNGEAARRELEKLNNTVASFKKQAAAAYESGDKALGDKMMKSAKQLERQFNVATKEVKDLQKVLNTLDSSTIDELTRAKKALNMQIRKLVPGTKEYIAATQNYTKVEARLKSLNAAYRQVDESQGSMFSRLSAGFNKYFGIAAAAVASITGISMTFRKAAQSAAELDDIYSDVMKTTGLLHDEVKQLDEELMKMDTRTSREALLGLARDAGKLGITGKENVLAFVDAADKINVALGEDLGEGAIRNLGKISDVFGLTDSLGIGDSLTKVGSAINAVGQASTANEAYLVQFTQRLAGAMAQAKISVADTIGFASAFDQSGMAVEMASTALQQFITKMFTDTATFAKYAKMEVGDFTELLETDANQAIVAVMKSLNQSGGFSEMIGMFQDMGADGVRAVSALSAVAKNIDAVTEAQALANVEFEKGTSLQQEFDTKNNNLQAQLEKARKEFSNATIALGQSLNPVLLKSTKLTTYLIKALASYGKEIVVAASVIAALTIAVKLHNAQVKIGAVLHTTWTTTAGVLKAAFYLLTGQFKKATAQMAAMNTVMKASVWGLVAAAVVAATVAVSKWIKKSREAKEAQNDLAKIEEKATERYKDQESEVRVLNKIVHDNNISLDERKRALAKLKEIVPGYLADLSKEGELVNDNTEAITNYINTMRQKAVMEVMSEEIKEMEKQRIEAERRLEDAKLKRDSELQKAGGDATESTISYRYTSQGAAVQMTKFTDYGKAVQEVTQKERELNELIQKQDRVYASYNRTVEENKNVILKDAEATEELTEATESGFSEALKKLEAQQEEELNTIKQSYIDKEINQAEYQESVEDSNIAFLNKKLALAQQYGEDETKYQAAILDAEIKQMERMNAEMEKLRQADTKDAEKENDEKLRQEQKHLDDMKKLAQHFKRELLSPIDEYQEEKQQLDEVYAAKLLSEEEYQKLLLAMRKKYADKAMQETARTENRGLIDQYTQQKQTLTQMLDSQMLTQEEYEKSLLQLRVEYGKKATEQISSFLDAASNLISSMRDAELSAAEAQYQADLTAAGDNEEEKERIEAEYEQKQLDIKKKYANADMAISIAKALAEGALAVVRCFSDLGPVAGAVMAGIIGATTAAQVATIIAQRNAIMNTSASSSSSSSSSSSTSTGTRTLSGGGMKEGGFAGSDPSDNTPMGVYHANEYIAPAWMVRQNPILFRNMEQYRTTGHRPQSFTQGMKEGGYTSQTAAQASGGFDTKALNETMAKMNATMEKMMNEGVQSFMVYDQFKDFENQRNRFKKITSR